MSEFPPLLLEKHATTSSLSHNLFCQLQTKGKWLIILESLKTKNKHGQRLQPSTKQIRFSYELKMIYIYGVHLGLLPQTSPGGLRLWAILVFYLNLYLFGWGSCLGVVRDRTSWRGALKKEIWVIVRAPLFWVVVWSRHLFFIQKNEKK